MEDVNRIKLVLVEKKRTNKWLSEQMGVTPSTVSKWCTNSSQPDLPSLLKISDLLEVDIRELIVREYKSFLLSQESNEMVLREDDSLKFKNPEDAQPVYNMLLVMAEGYAARYRNAAVFDFETVMNEFEKTISILKNNFYKEEYLK